MKPASFDYHAPPTLAEAVELMARLHEEGVDAKILAGGQSLMPMLAMRVARPEVLVDLGKIKSLDYIREGRGDRHRCHDEQAGGRGVGADRTATPLSMPPPNWSAIDRFATGAPVEGRLLTPTPLPNIPPWRWCSTSSSKPSGPEGERTIPAGDFFVTYATTSLESTEVLTEGRLPVLPAGTGWAIQEFARRNGDLALAGVATTPKLAAGVCADVRLAAFGVNATAAPLDRGRGVPSRQASGPAPFWRRRRRWPPMTWMNRCRACMPRPTTSAI
ncbi:MAG: FAD binding domain-containing protein [Rhodocyclaceae bacterium]|nr:FAD binding domain-containing protein [Rhodocyclaceae bacterium]